MNKESFAILCARGADRTMHAALYLTGAYHQKRGIPFNLNYSDPRVWESADPAVIMLRERYQFLYDVLDQVRTLEDIGLVYRD